MCGIAGIINFNEDMVDPYLMKKMTSIIAHRGPDDEGHVLLNSMNDLQCQKVYEFNDPAELGTFELSGYNIGLGFRRLSIIDLSPSGHQPMSNEDNSVWIVFNGEFYNYFEYISELKSKGHKFKSKTDTEVILHLYEEYGIEETIKRINGMFAFALFDNRKNLLFLVRDRVGIKPLYYYRSKNILVFASEIKALLEVPTVPKYFHASMIPELLRNRYVNAPNTVFYDIKKVIPGTYWKFDLHRRRSKEATYWSAFDNIHEYSKASKKDYQELLIKSINFQMNSDVPLGVFLSGGLDSSTICGIIRSEIKKHLKTFSVEFDSPSGVDERWASRQVAKYLRTEHYGFEFKYNVFDMLPKLLWHCEEPIADPALLPTYKLCKRTREHVTVALAGEGSDETNYGYEVYKLGIAGIFIMCSPKFLKNYLLSLQHLLPKKSRIYKSNSIMDNPVSNDDNEGFMSDSLIKILIGEQIDRAVNMRGLWWKKNFKAKSIFDVLPLIHFHTWLSDNLLLKVDKMSMAHSLEVRVPYLDHNIIENLFNINAEQKISATSTKRILREIAKSWLPDAIIKRKQHGFLVPLISSFNNDLFLKPRQESHLRNYLKPLGEIIEIEKLIRTLAPRNTLSWNASVWLWLMVMAGLCIDQFNLTIK